MDLLSRPTVPPAPTGRSVAVLGTQDLSAFELGVACEVFGTDRSDRGIPLWDFALCLPEPGPIRIRSGFTVDSPYGLDRVATADLVDRARLAAPGAAAAGAGGDRAAGGRDRGSWVLGFCSGTFALAYAGLLDGRRATTHWHYAAEFRALFPDVELDRDVLYVADGPVLTSAGTVGRDRPVAARAAAGATAPRWPTRWPAGWWCRRTGTAARHSSSSARCRSTTGTT